MLDWASVMWSSLLEPTRVSMKWNYMKLNEAIRNRWIASAPAGVCPDVYQSKLFALGAGRRRCWKEDVLVAALEIRSQPGTSLRHSGSYQSLHQNGWNRYKSAKLEDCYWKWWIQMTKLAIAMRVGRQAEPDGSSVVDSAQSTAARSGSGSVHGSRNGSDWFLVGTVHHSPADATWADGFHLPRIVPLLS